MRVAFRFVLTFQNIRMTRISNAECRTNASYRILFGIRIIIAVIMVVKKDSEK